MDRMKCWFFPSCCQNELPDDFIREGYDYNSYIEENERKQYEDRIVKLSQMVEEAHKIQIEYDNEFLKYEEALKKKQEIKIVEKNPNKCIRVSKCPHIKCGLTDMKQRVKYLQKELTEKNDELVAFQKAYSEKTYNHREQVEKLTSDIFNYKKSYDALYQQVNEVILERNNLKRDVGCLSSQNRDLANKCGLLEQRVDVLINDNKYLTASRDRLKEMLKKYEKI